MVHLDGYVLGAGSALSCMEVGWEALVLIQPQGISAHRCAQHLLLQLPLKKKKSLQIMHLYLFWRN